MLFIRSERITLLTQLSSVADFEFTDVSGRLFPAVGFMRRHIIMETNFSNSADKPLLWQH